MRLKASILVGLLWCVAFLTVLVVGLLHTAHLDLLVVKNQGDLIQAHYLALAGIEKAKALLYRDAMDRRRTAKNHTGDLYNAPEYFRDVSFGRGEFRVFRQGSREEGGAVIYGVSDEESRLNINRASAEELGKLYGITPDVVAAILEYRGDRNSATNAPAAAGDYGPGEPPYFPRRAPLETTRELLMVRGVSPELFMGEDVNQNGLLDPEEDDGNASYPPDNADGVLDAGWSGMITVDSLVKNVNASGEYRVNIRSADENLLASVRGISADLAKAIVAYRGQNRLESLSDLLDVTPVQPQNQPPMVSQTGRGPALGGPVPGVPGNMNPGQQNVVVQQTTSAVRPGAPASGPSGGPGPSGPASGPASGEKLISESMLMEMADDLTSETEDELPGLVNLNTASRAVLACLPGVDEQLAEAIVSYRHSSGFFENIAKILAVPGMNRIIFKQIAPHLTARSETFRILSEGKIGSTGARKRIQAIVHIDRYEVQTLSYREDL